MVSISPLVRIGFDAVVDDAVSGGGTVDCPFGCVAAHAERTKQRQSCGEIGDY
jgi:hypothetical protein